MPKQEKRTESVGSTINPNQVTNDLTDSIVTYSDTENKSNRGGKREGAGRKKQEDTSYKTTSKVIETDITELDTFPEDGVFHPFQANTMKGQYFAFVVYPESAPGNWKKQLELKGIKFAVSPLHDRDTEITDDGTEKPKKPHWHIIVDFGATTTIKHAFETITKITHGTHPYLLKKPSAYYRYLTHLDSHDKFPYYEDPEATVELYNGFTPLESASRTQLITDLMYRMLMHIPCIMEYSELVVFAQSISLEHLEDVIAHTIFWSKICDSYRHMGSKARNKERQRLWTLQNDENPYTNWLDIGELEDEDDVPEDVEITVRNIKRAEIKGKVNMPDNIPVDEDFLNEYKEYLKQKDEKKGS